MATHPGGGWQLLRREYTFQDHGYRIKRLSDGIVLPTEFSDDDVRQEKHRRNLWWY